MTIRRPLPPRRQPRSPRQRRRAQALRELHQRQFFARWRVITLIEAVEEIQRLQQRQVAHV